MDRSRNRHGAVSNLEQKHSTKLLFPGERHPGTAVARGVGMQKLNPLCYLTLALVTLIFASCASQPAMTSTTSTTTTTTQSPMNRDNNNGLASFIH